MKRLYPLHLIIAFGFQSHAQDEIPNVYLSEILEKTLFSGKDTVKYAGVNIKQENGTIGDANLYSHNWHTFFPERYPNKAIRTSRSAVNRQITP